MNYNYVFGRLEEFKTSINNCVSNDDLEGYTYYRSKLYDFSHMCMAYGFVINESLDYEGACVLYFTVNGSKQEPDVDLNLEAIVSTLCINRELVNRFYDECNFSYNEACFLDFIDSENALRRLGYTVYPLLRPGKGFYIESITIEPNH